MTAKIAPPSPDYGYFLPSNHTLLFLCPDHGYADLTTFERRLVYAQVMNPVQIAFSYRLFHLETGYVQHHSLADTKYSPSFIHRHSLRPQHHVTIKSQCKPRIRTARPRRIHHMNPMLPAVHTCD